MGRGREGTLIHEGWLDVETRAGQMYKDAEKLRRLIGSAQCPEGDEMIPVDVTELSTCRAVVAEEGEIVPTACARCLETY